LKLNTENQMLHLAKLLTQKSTKRNRRRFSNVSPIKR